MNAYAQPTLTPFRQYKIHPSNKIAESLRRFTRDTGVFVTPALCASLPCVFIHVRLA